MKRVFALILVMALLLCGCGFKNPLWQEQLDLGVRYLNEGNYAEAILYFSTAIEIDPNNPDAYVLRGDAYARLADEYTQMGDLETAWDYLQRARQDYITAEGLDARNDYDMDLRYQQVNELELRAEETAKDPARLRELYRNYFYDFYSNEDKVCLADVTGDGLEEMMVVHFEEFNRVGYAGYVYSVIDGRVQMIYQNWDVSSWYLVDYGYGYALAEEIHDEANVLSYTEYILDTQADRREIFFQSLDWGDPANLKADGDIKDEVYDVYYNAVTARMHNCYCIHYAYYAYDASNDLETYPPAVFGLEVSESVMDVTVVDAYSDSGTWSNGVEYSYQIPRFEMEGDLAAAVNEQIYGQMYALVTQTYVVASGMSNVINYAWGQNQSLCSTVIRYGDTHMSGMGYEVYTISKSTGQLVGREELLASCGFTEEMFRSMAAQRLEEAYEVWYGYARSVTGEGPDGTTGAQAYAEGLRYSLDGISDAEPFLDSQGRLCAKVGISPVWDYASMEIICLEGDSWEPAANWTA